MKPNFLIVGAPKCGTTALWRYLNDHPDVFMSPRKDMHFFGSDLDFTKRSRFSQQEYEHFFVDAHQKAIGEASVWYLYSQKAAQEIAAYQPDMKIIIMVRDPIQIMYAHYTQLKLNGLGDEDIPTFAQALAAQEDRKKGLRIPRHNTLPSALLYTEVARLSVQIQRYMDHFPKENILVLFQEDMKKDMHKMYIHTLEFLGVDPQFSTEFTRINSHKEVRSEGFRRLIGAIPQPLKNYIPQDFRERFRKLVRKYNTRHAKRPPLDPQLERALRKDFDEEIRLLSALIERNIDHWRM